MRRLYLQIYAAVLGVLLLFALLMSGVFWQMDDDHRPARWLDELTAFADASIPPPDADADRLARWAKALARPFELDLAVYDGQGRRLVAVGEAMPAPPATGGSRFLPDGGYGHRVFALALSDGRWLVARGDHMRRPLPHFLAAIALLAIATGIAAHPLARRLTRRVENLKRHVEDFGEGRLALRVPVEGHDEIARLALAFNATAERIERLVADKTRLLANTSHELRTPLARVRAALELLGDGPRPDLIRQAESDLMELDELIGELLVSSRLDAPERVLERESIDLLALAAEEAARLPGVEVSGTSHTTSGDPRLIRRLLRNLLENALRHGEPPVCVEVGPSPRSGSVRVAVLDHGPGVPESLREKIFEPFYRPAGSASSRGGIGLGLALVRQIAERHGGHVACEARAGGGTRFLLDLPAERT